MIIRISYFDLIHSFNENFSGAFACNKGFKYPTRMTFMPSRKTFVIPKNHVPGSLGLLFGEMEEVRRLLLKEIKGISQEILDYTPDINTFETIGTMLFHVA
ncbi:MAG: hypothetical protein ACW99A_11595, partial [Candidatus Kariarchaeaceae archaeon]